MTFKCLGAEKGVSLEARGGLLGGVGSLLAHGVQQFITRLHHILFHCLTQCLLVGGVLGCDGNLLLLQSLLLGVELLNVVGGLQEVLEALGSG